MVFPHFFSIFGAIGVTRQYVRAGDWREVPVGRQSNRNFQNHSLWPIRIRAGT
jgi:hypothetical protein